MQGAHSAQLVQECGGHLPRHAGSHLGQGGIPRALPEYRSAVESDRIDIPVEITGGEIRSRIIDGGR